MSKLFSITEEYRLSLSYLIIKILGVKFKFVSGSIPYLVFYPLKTGSNLGKNNKIILKDEKGNEKRVHKIKGLCVDFKGDDNSVIIHKGVKLFRSNILCDGSNNSIEFHENSNGTYKILAYGNNCKASIGKKTKSCDTTIHLYKNEIEIGEDCLFSNNIRILTDVHKVINKDTNEVLNSAKDKIKIGNHVWVGERVTMTKNAQIPDNCVIGIASVVTKKFDEEYCVIAGAPAKIVKHNINWIE